MLTGRRFQGDGKVTVFVFICVVTVVLSGSYLFAAERGAIRQRVFSLKHISAEQGKNYLAEVGVDTVSQLPGREVLLVTGQAKELIKATAVLKLVDTEELFYIKPIFPVSEVSNFPSNEQIAAEVGNVSIGTFLEPPTDGAKSKAIIDVCEDAVIAIAPAEQFEGIVSVIEWIQGTGTDIGEKETEAIADADVERAEAEIKIAEAELKELAASFELSGDVDDGNDESDRLFNELLESIAEANEAREHKVETEEAAVEKAPQLSQPNTIEVVPPTKGPNEPSVDLKNTEESAFQTTEELQSAEQPATEPRFPVVVRSDDGAAEKLKAEPKFELAPEAPLPLSQRRGLYEPRPIAEGDEMLELDLPERLNIIDLLDLVGKYLKLDYMYDEAKVKGDVALRLQGPVKIKDLYPLLESVLKFRGFVMARKGNFVTIVPAGEALDIDPVLVDPNVSQLELGDIVVTRIFELNYIGTASAKNLLDGMKLGANVTPIEDAGLLIVTGYAYRMGRVEKLLGMIDRPGEPKQFRFRQLKYTMAETLAPKIEELAEQLGTVSVTIAAPSAAEPRGRPTRRIRRPSATPSESAEAEPSVYLDADERTNRILMIGLEDQLAVVENLIDTLDVEQRDFRTLRLYDIQHVGAEEVVKKLKELGIIGTIRETAGTRISRPPVEK